MQRLATLGCLVLLGTFTVGHIGITRVDAQAPACLHGSDENPDQKARRTQALGFTRHVNTLEAVAVSTMGSYQPATALSLTESLPSGFILRLTASKDSYAFSVQDTSDPCRFVYYSDSAGVIFMGEAIR